MSSISALLQAIDFAADRHRSQRRKGPDRIPYVNHLIDVANLLATLARVSDVEILSAAVLHDVLEDTDTTPEEVRVRFGDRVLQLVVALSDDKSLPRSLRRQAVLDHLPLAEDAVKLVKLADLCSNASSLPVGWSAARQREYLDWSRQAAAICAGLEPELDRLYEARATAARARCAARE